MKKKILAGIGLLAIAAALMFSARKAESQTNFIQSPQANYNWAISDYTGTNIFAYSATNNRPIVTQNGTNSFAVVDADIIYTNTAGTTRHLIFKNGILVNSL